MTAVPSKPVFGLWTLVALVVGNAVGAGIYTTSGFALTDLGSREWVLLAWVVAGLIALCGAVSYSMLVRGITESGGEYLYLSRSIHPIAGYVAGWISLLAGFPGAIAFAATAFESYTVASIPFLEQLPNDVLAVIVTLLAGLVHIVRVRSGARAHEWIVGFMLLVLVVLIAWSGWQLVSVPRLADTTTLTTFSLFAFANSLVWISLSYSGFNAAAYVAGEVDDAKRIVPLGMIYGTFATLLLCVLVNAIMLYAAPASELVGRPDIALVAARSLSGDIGVWVIQLVIAVSLLTSITAMVLAGPRVYAKMAEDGALPRLFKAKEGEPPRASIMLQVATALVLILIADLRDLLSYLGLTLSLCLALAVTSLFVRHFRLGERPVSKLYPIAPITFVVCTVGFAGLSAMHAPLQFVAAIPTILAGVVAYYLTRRQPN
ncbi:MAG: amino acid permease [Arenicella sp.]|jgi:APA family basic amino acid/polyamine antiporter|nr:amino acid permease [Arenicella sp.]HAU67206.1 APC family permease [Gammaproteobacteria bacterium]